ncbi:MAG: hypothetical protein KBS58_07160 [Bacteroidales bacterium]|nr:hypothetical protein [Candidatus Cacconaster equi]
MAKHKKKKVAPGFQGQSKSELLRHRRKTILFNEKEMSLIDQYCSKFSIKNKSSFIRNIVLSHIMDQLDKNYPKLF